MFTFFFLPYSNNISQEIPKKVIFKNPCEGSLNEFANLLQPPPLHSLTNHFQLATLSNTILHFDMFFLMMNNNDPILRHIHTRCTAVFYGFPCLDRSWVSHKKNVPFCASFFYKSYLSDIIFTRLYKSCMFYVLLAVKVISDLM